jgi:hypothetical protein
VARSRSTTWRSGGGVRDPRHVSRRAALVGIVLVLAGCASGAAGTRSPVPSSGDLRLSSSGLCAALAALPDEVAARRAFTNLAHDALHALAADPRLTRTSSARILEAMDRVEADFGQPAEPASLGNDLAELRGAAGAALGALGLAVPACAA